MQSENYSVAFHGWFLVYAKLFLFFLRCYLEILNLKSRLSFPLLTYHEQYCLMKEAEMGNSCVTDHMALEELFAEHVKYTRISSCYRL